MGIVVVGSIALDTISTPQETKERILGGSAVYASLALSPFSKPRLIGVIGEDFPEDHLRNLETRGVDLAGLQRVPGKTFSWVGEYGWDLSEATTRATHLNVFETFAPEVPAAYASEEFIFLGNIDPDLQKKVLAEMRQPKLVATDTINLWLDLKRDALVSLLERVNVFFINGAEAKKLSGENKILNACRKISQWGPRLVVVKSGEHGAVAYDGKTGGFYMAPAYPDFTVVDPTGAGDSFAGGFLGSIMQEKNPFSEDSVKKALYMGNVLASFAIAHFSVEGLLRLSSEDVHRRFSTLLSMTHTQALALRPAGTLVSTF